MVSRATILSAFARTPCGELFFKQVTMHLRPPTPTTRTFGAKGQGDSTSHFSGVNFNGLGLSLIGRKTLLHGSPYKVYCERCRYMQQSARHIDKPICDNESSGQCFWLAAGGQFGTPEHRVGFETIFIRLKIRSSRRC